MLIKSLIIHFCAFILCITATAVKAGPTVGISGLVSLRGCNQVNDVSLSAPAMALSSKAELAIIGRGLLQPPTNIYGVNNISLAGSNSLPSAPAAVLLVLTGFLCVTGVKDRKEWFAVLAAMLWLSQAGVTALPNFILHYQSQKHIRHSSCLEKGDAYLFENSSRLRSEVEGSEYINLIHHLSSIPDDQSSTIDNIDTAQLAIVFTRDMLNLDIHCTAVFVEQFTCFSPAFIFSNQSRGPPLFA